MILNENTQAEQYNAQADENLSVFENVKEETKLELNRGDAAANLTTYAIDVTLIAAEIKETRVCYRVCSLNVCC
jgi:hypothetical protein